MAEAQVVCLVQTVFEQRSRLCLRIGCSVLAHTYSRIDQAELLGLRHVYPRSCGQGEEH